MYDDIEVLALSIYGTTNTYFTTDWAIISLHDYLHRKITNQLLMIPNKEKGGIFKITCNSILPVLVC
jgi:hypothetical protein